MDKITINHTEWNLKPLFENDDDPHMADERRAMEKAHRAFAQKWKANDGYLKYPAVLKEALSEYEKLRRMYAEGGSEWYYFSKLFSQNQEDSSVKSKMTNIEDFAIHLENEVLFFELGLAKVELGIQENFLAYSDLQPYHHYLERLFKEGKHMLSKEAEQILRLKRIVAHDKWKDMISEFLSGEEREVLLEDGTRARRVQPQIMSLIESTQKMVRDDAARALNEIFSANTRVAEHEMNAVLQNKKVDDELRGYLRPDAERHLYDDIDSEAVDILIRAVTERFDISQRYYALKARLMNVSKLAYHERNVPYGSFDMKYSFEDATMLVREVFAALDPEFLAIFERFLQEGTFDVFPKKGKEDGAFCASGLLSHPTYILLNFMGTLRDVKTLAHESGHGINNELMRKFRHALDFGIPLSTAEVASIFMEDFVLDAIAEGADDEKRLALLMNRLNDDVSTLFRQIACYRFEEELHKMFREKSYLSREAIGEIFSRHMYSYMGDAVEQSPGSENWWVYWGHIRTFFYVYAYANGALIAKSLQSSVRTDHSFIEKVKDFLAAGLSRSPKESFAQLGIDITSRDFWMRGLESIDQNLFEAERLAKKLGKIL